MLVFAALALGGCGIKGPLYMPQPDQTGTKKAHKSSTPATPTTTDTNTSKDSAS